jgi:DNA processing protein
MTVPLILSMAENLNDNVSLKSAEPWLLLSTVPGVGQIRLSRLIQHFGSPEKVFKARDKDLLSLEGMNRKIIEGIKRGGNRKRVEEELARMQRYRISLVTNRETSYPENLRTFENSPPFLYVRGSLLPRDQNAIAIVGSRKATFYGKGIAEEFGFELAKRGVTIVSGMARGIDTAAHNGALKAQGRTLAILGCGVDMVYPPENRGLRDRIIESGAVLSEFHLGTQPIAGNFPQRNRIISGLSLGVICVEASDDSGVFSTVQWAADQGREVFAVPGDVKRKSSLGTNRLIRDGVKMVTGIEDILEELHFPSEPDGRSGVPSESSLKLSDKEKAVYDQLSGIPIHIDEISEKITLSTPETLFLLLSLELKGVVRQMPGKTFTRS